MQIIRPAFPLIFILLASIVAISVGEPLAQAQAKAVSSQESPPATRYSWRAGIRGRFIDDELSEANVVGIVASARLEHEFSDWISTDLEMFLKAENGSSQSLFTEEFRARQGFQVGEAKINIIPTNFFSFHFGALDQEYHYSDIFLFDDAFPAIMEKFTIPNLGPWHLFGYAQQSIATSSTFSTRSLGKEPTPYLYIHTLRFGYKDPEAIELNARATYFIFQDLTRGIAQDSRFYGNTVLGSGAPNARFFYNFQGWEAGLDAKVHLSDSWKLRFYNSYVNNSKAPRPKNRGNYATFGIRYVAPRLEIEPSVGYLKVESDPVPGFFNSRFLGHNNRKGTPLGLEFRFPKEKLVFSTTYVRAKVIERTPVQYDRTIIQVKVGTESMSF